MMRKRHLSNNLSSNVSSNAINGKDVLGDHAATNNVRQKQSRPSLLLNGFSSPLSLC